MSTLSQKTEGAMKAQAETVSLANRGNAAVYPGLDGVELPANRIEVSAKQGREDESGTGNYWMECEVRVYSLSTTAGSEAAHDAKSENVVAVFNIDSLEEELSALVSGFCCMGILDREIIEREKQDRSFMSGYRFRALCAPSDF